MHAERAVSPPGAVPSPFWLAFWLAVCAVCAKLWHWDASRVLDDRQQWLLDAGVSSHADVLFALGFGLASCVLLRAARPWPAWQRRLGHALLALGAFCALYAVASVKIFAFLRSPLTYALLYLAGDFGSMRSSLGSFVSPGLLAALTLATAGYVLAVRLCSRRVQAGPSRLRGSVPLMLTVVALAWGRWGHLEADGRWSDRPDLLIAKSPHWEFLSSLYDEARGGGGPVMSDDFPRAFLSDFEPGPGAALDPATPVLLPVALHGAPARPRPRNVLQVVLETTGARYLSLYGSKYATTPNLDREAAHALVFDKFYAHVGQTANSLAAMSLSIYPYMTWREYTQEYPDFPGQTLADVLGPRGYRAAFLTSSFLDYVGMDGFLRGRGFDQVLDWPALAGGAQSINSWGGSDALLVDRTLEWIDRDRARPFYAVVWTQQSHHPYDPVPGQQMVDFFAGGPPPADDWDLGRYLNTLAEVDRQLGRLFAGLRERGLDRDTLVVVTGDHGEGFGAPHPTWGHGFRLYQEAVQVPLMLWSPALFPEGRRVSTIGGHVDLNPTIAHLLDVPPAPSWRGRSLFANERPPRAYFYAANDDYLLGVREGDFKYVYNATRGREELYDLTQDPEEQRNVAGTHAERCRVLRQRLAAWKHHAAQSLQSARRPHGEVVDGAPPGPQVALAR